MRRVLIQIISLILLVIEVYRVISCTRGDAHDTHILMLAIEAVTMAWAVLISLSLLLTRSIQTFGTSLQSVFTANLLLTIHFYIVVVSRDLVHADSTPTSSVTLAVLGTALTTTVLIGTTRQEPGRYRDRSRIYNEAVAQKLKAIGGEAFESNVMASGQSIIGRFFSSHMFAVVFSITTKDQVDLHELPVLPGDMQAEPSTLTWMERDTKSGTDAHTTSASLLWLTIWTQRETWILCEQAWPIAGKGQNWLTR